MHQIIVSDGSGGYLQKPVYDRTYLMAETSNISASGRYIAVTYRKVTAVNNVETATPYPAIYDIETDTFTILTDLPGGFSSGTARTASNIGQLAYACQKEQTYIGYVYDLNSGTTRAMPAFTESEYGFVLTSEESYIMRFAADGEAILGGTYIYSGSALDFWYMAVLE